MSSAIDDGLRHWWEALLKSPVYQCDDELLALGHPALERILVSPAKARRLGLESLYWTNAGDGTVMAVPTSGGTPVILAHGQGSPYGIAASTTAIYWTDQDGGTVMKVAPNGGTPVTLASGEPTPYALALDDTNVYFTTYVANGSVMKLTEGCTCP